MKRKELRELRVSQGLCKFCGLVPHTEFTKGCGPCNDKASKIQKKFISQNKDYNKQYRDETRVEVLSHYGNRCVCCNESEPKFLALDHMNNDGAAHRREISSNGHPVSSYQMYLWIKKNNYPDNFQILCHNCNMAKSFYGICPHMETEKAVKASEKLE